MRQRSEISKFGDGLKHPFHLTTYLVCSAWLVRCVAPPAATRVGSPSANAQGARSRKTVLYLEPVPQGVIALREKIELLLRQRAAADQPGDEEQPIHLGVRSLPPAPLPDQS